MTECWGGIKRYASTKVRLCPLGNKKEEKKYENLMGFNALSKYWLKSPHLLLGEAHIGNTVLQGPHLCCCIRRIHMMGEW